MKYIASPIVAFIFLLGILLVLLPWFIRMPVWVDVTYHDISAWNILHQGVHYRDIFETNLPGMVWLHAVLRPLIGWSHEAIRIADLVVFASICIGLVRILRECGIQQSGRIWFLVAVCLFYLSETEFIHVQRDGWMLLPATWAVYFHLLAFRSESWRHGFIEGILWGLALWIKPHVLVPALAIWLVTFRFITVQHFRQLTTMLFAGGATVGIFGVMWLYFTGTWSPMWDVLLNWNGEYYNWSPDYLWAKTRWLFHYFPPFSLLHYVAILFSLVSVVRRHEANRSRAFLAAFYLGWLLQATIIQKEFDYAHSPPMILAIAVVASVWLPVGPVLFLWCLSGSLINQHLEQLPLLRRWNAHQPNTFRMVVPDHSIASEYRLKRWGRCWTDGSWKLKDELTNYKDIHCVPDWDSLNDVTEFLRQQNVGDRDVICWHDSTHPIYIALQIRPGIRYPHVMTAMKFRSKLPLIQQETFTSPARFIVADLVPCLYLEPNGPHCPAEPGAIDQLPNFFPKWDADVYPWNQQPIFRSGRYVVFRSTNPHGTIEFPLPEGLK